MGLSNDAATFMHAGDSATGGLPTSAELIRGGDRSSSGSDAGVN